MYYAIFGISAFFSSLGVFFIVRSIVKAQKAKKHFNITKGMTYEQVVAILGQPTVNAKFGNGYMCEWKPTLDAKTFKIVILFKNGIAKTFA